jgi:hypothetical protein
LNRQRRKKVLYDVRIENWGARDILVTGVSEDMLGETISSWCGKHTTIIVTQSEEQEKKDEVEH